MHGYGFDMMSGWGGMWFGPILMLLVTVAIVLLVVWLVRSAARGGTSYRNRTAREVLDESYAKGEIDDDEYKRRRSAIER